MITLFVNLLDFGKYQMIVMISLIDWESLVIILPQNIGHLLVIYHIHHIIILSQSFERKRSNYRL